MEVESPKTGVVERDDVTLSMHGRVKDLEARKRGRKRRRTEE